MKKLAQCVWELIVCIISIFLHLMWVIEIVLLALLLLVCPKLENWCKCQTLGAHLVILKTMGFLCPWRDLSDAYKLYNRQCEKYGHDDMKIM